MSAGVARPVDARTAPGVRRGRSVRDFSALLLSTLVFQAVRMGLGVWAAAALGPALFGRWNLLAALIGYAPIAHLGVVNGMARDVPIALGRGEAELAGRTEARTFAVVLLASLGVGSLWALSPLLPPVRAWSAPGILWAAGAVTAANLLFGYFQLRARAKFQFTAQALQLAVAAGVMLAGYAAWGRHAGLAGFILSMTAGYAAAAGLAWLADPVKPRWGGRTGELRALVAVGFPILSAGLLFALLTSVDRWVIARALGTLEVGLYTPAVLVFGAASLAPAVVSQLGYSQMAFAWGRQPDRAGLRSRIARQSLTALLAALPVLVVLWWILPGAVERFLPEYVAGIGAGRWMLLGGVAVALATGPGNFLNTTGHHGLYLALQGTGVVLNTVFSAAAATAGWGIGGVAAASALTLLVYAGALAVSALRFARTPEGERC